MKQARLELRLDPDIKAKAEKASALLGLKSLTEYVVKVIDENASQVVANHEKLILENDLFDRFAQACIQANPPNQALKDAFKFSKKQGFM